MSFNQRSWHQTHEPRDTLSATPVRLELLPERTPDLELYTAEMLQRIQEELQWYRQLYNHSPCIHFSLDATGMILSVNQFGANCLGYTPDQLVQTSILNLFDLTEKKRISEALIGLGKTSLPDTFNGEYRLDCLDSKIAWVKVRFNILSDEDVHIHKTSSIIVMVCEDITAYKQQEDTDQESESHHKSQTLIQTHLAERDNLSRLKEEFLSTVSHELRTPLSNMKMAIQMLGIALHQEHKILGGMSKPSGNNSKISRYFEILNNECEREINLINNFLDLQNLDISDKPWLLETIQVQQWLRRLLELFQIHNLSIYKQKISLNIAPNLPVLICDSFILERIFKELLTNACKFSPPNAKITISADLKLQNIEFQVINYGVEISESELPHIFDKFYRIPSTEARNQGGTGLG